MSEPFYPLLFGGDINVYSVARAFHEAYGIKSTAYGKYASGPCARSKIIDYRVCADNEDEKAFVRNATAFAEEHTDGKVFVIGCGDAYVRLAAENAEFLPKNCIVATVSGNRMRRLTDKEKFYGTCDEYGIDHPATVSWRPDMGHDFDLPFEPPYICKPANSVSYWEHPFEGNDKVFLLPDRDALCDVLDRCAGAGYPDAMLIQDRIPGDDSAMRVLTCYSDRHGKVVMMCLGHVLLEEHTPHGLGNHAVILTEQLTPETRALCEKIHGFLDDIGYVGFSNFDIKYDERDGRFAAFEINCRQGRSNYYVTGAGMNIATLLVRDYIEQEEIPFTMVEEESLWAVVPKKVLKRFIAPEYQETMFRLISEGKDSNSLIYKGDRGILRRIWVRHNINSHKKKFAKYYQRKDRPNELMVR